MNHKKDISDERKTGSTSGRCHNERWPDSPGVGRREDWRANRRGLFSDTGGFTSGNPVNPLLGRKSTARRNRFRAARPVTVRALRTYSSYRTKTPAPVGIFVPGWKAPFDIRLQIRDNELILNDNGGRSIHFEHLFPVRMASAAANYSGWCAAAWRN